MIHFLALIAFSRRAAAADDLSCADDFRSLSSIVWSCFTTIFLCTWISFHPNVFEPIDTKGLGAWRRFRIWLPNFFEDRFLTFMAALVAPEAILSLAVRQWMVASLIAKENGITRQQAFFIIMGGYHSFERETPSTTAPESDHRPSDSHQRARAAIMEPEFGTPCHPLDRYDVLHLLKTDKIQLPLSEELEDKCTSTALAKAIVLVQTLWFIVQCIARKIEHLPLTELEVITLGYTLINLCIYIAWWDKPYEITFPIRVFEALPELDANPERSKARAELFDPTDKLFGTVFTSQFDFESSEWLDLRTVRCVSMWYTGQVSHAEEYDVSVGSLGVVVGIGTLFGAVHFLAWSSPFPSHRIQFLWRLSSIVITTAPLILALGGCILFGLINRYRLVANLTQNPLMACLSILLTLVAILLPLFYVVQRGMTIVIAFLTLKSLPLDIYKDVDWPNFIPHSAVSH